LIANKLFPKYYVSIIKQKSFDEITRLNTQKNTLDIKREKINNEIENEAAKLTVEINSDIDALVGLISVVNKDNIKASRNTLCDINARANERELAIKYL
jgi:hypothetical protein